MIQDIPTPPPPSDTIPAPFKLTTWVGDAPKAKRHIFTHEHISIGAMTRRPNMSLCNRFTTTERADAYADTLTLDDSFCPSCVRMVVRAHGAMMKQQRRAERAM